MGQARAGLVLTRRVGEKICLGNKVLLEVVSIGASNSTFKITTKDGSGIKIDTNNLDKKRKGV